MPRTKPSALLDMLLAKKRAAGATRLARAQRQPRRSSERASHARFADISVLSPRRICRLRFTNPRSARLLHWERQLLERRSFCPRWHIALQHSGRGAQRAARSMASMSKIQHILALTSPVNHAAQVLASFQRRFEDTRSRAPDRLLPSPTRTTPTRAMRAISSAGPTSRLALVRGELSNARAGVHADAVSLQLRLAFGHPCPNRPMPSRRTPTSAAASRYHRGGCQTARIVSASCRNNSISRASSASRSGPSPRRPTSITPCT